MVSATEVREAFTALGLKEGSSLELVKTTYKKVALQTHPDKNPDNPSATEDFQRVSAAYRLLSKHLDGDGATETPIFNGYGAYNPFGYGGFSSDEDEGDFNDFYEDSDYNDDLAFYLFLFEKIMGGRGFGSAPPRKNAHRNHSAHSVHETQAQYQERLRRTRQEQEEAEERRKRTTVERKKWEAEQREKERINAEKRQKAKLETKKARADAERMSSEARAREMKRVCQEVRSSLFAAARNGETQEVKKVIWEKEIEPSGGEVQQGCSEYVKTRPRDPHETLLHIATKSGDLDLVKWLDSHSADPEERNSEGLTAFQLALKTGKQAIAKFFIDNYSPDSPEHQGIYHCSTSTNLIRLALESRDPEPVWLVLEHKLATVEEIHEAWIWASSEKGIQSFRSGQSSSVAGVEKAGDIIKLLSNYDTKNRGAASHSVPHKVHVNQPSTKQIPELKSQGSAKQRRGQGHNQRRGRGTGRGHGRGRGASTSLRD